MLVKKSDGVSIMRQWLSYFVFPLIITLSLFVINLPDTDAARCKVLAGEGNCYGAVTFLILAPEKGKYIRSDLLPKEVFDGFVANYEFSNPQPDYIKIDYVSAHSVPIDAGGDLPTYNMGVEIRCLIKVTLPIEDRSPGYHAKIKFPAVPLIVSSLGGNSPASSPIIEFDIENVSITLPLEKEKYMKNWWKYLLFALLFMATSVISFLFGNKFPLGGLWLFVAAVSIVGFIYCSFKILKGFILF